MKGRIEINKERCKGCGLCINVCPKKRILISATLNTKGYYPARFKDEKVKDLDRTECTGCALCAITCPDVAIDVYRQTKDESSKQKEKSKEE